MVAKFTARSLAGAPFKPSPVRRIRTPVSATAGAAKAPTAPVPVTAVATVATLPSPVVAPTAVSKLPSSAVAT